jgi:glycosyl transferase, family 25
LLREAALHEDSGSQILPFLGWLPTLMGMDPLLGYFAPHIAVVNLPSRVDRRSETMAELETLGLTPPAYHFHDAIRVDDKGPFENRGTRGAYLSHLAVLCDAIAAGAPHLLVLEDDIEFAPGYAKVSADVLEELVGQRWDVVQFGYAIETSVTKRLAGDGPRLRPFDGEVTGGHFYAIHGEALPVVYEFLVRLLNGPTGHPLLGPMSTDGAFNVIKWEMPELHRLVAYPGLADQRSSRSDLRPRWFDRVPVLRPTAGFARGVLRRSQRLN